MPGPYSLDLRKRIIIACKESEKKLSEISKDFIVSVKTIQRWIKQYDKEGHVEAKTGYQKGHSHVIKDPQKLIEIIETKNLSTINEIIKEIGVGSKSTLSKVLKKLNYVKKNGKNYTKNKNQKR